MVNAGTKLLARVTVTSTYPLEFALRINELLSVEIVKGYLKENVTLCEELPTNTSFALYIFPLILIV